MSICIGCGLIVDSGILKTHLKVGGGLTCTDADGLAVIAQVASPDACNGLTVKANGLFAWCPDSVVGAQDEAAPQNSLLPLTMVGNDTDYFFEAAQITITNNLCCQVAGRISVQVGGLYVDAAAGFRGYARMLVNINGAGYTASYPETNKYVQNNGTGNILADFNNIRDDNYLVIDPSTSKTYRAELQVHQDLGSGILKALFGTGAGFEYLFELVQVGCC